MYWIRTNINKAGRPEPVYINLAIYTDAEPGRAAAYSDHDGNRMFEPVGLNNAKWKREEQDVRKLTLRTLGLDPVTGKPQILILYDEAAIEVMKHLETLNQMEETKK